MAKEIPKFRVTQAPGFFDGVRLLPPGMEIEWADPGKEGWDDLKNGPHFTKGGPSVTFEPLNEAARALQEEHRARIAKANAPRPTLDDEARARFAKMEEMHIEMLNKFGELAAAMRRSKEDEDDGKKKK